MLQLWTRLARHQISVLAFILKRITMFLWRLRLFIIIGFILVTSMFSLNLLTWMNQPALDERLSYCNPPAKVFGNEKKQYKSTNPLSSLRLSQLQIVIRHGDRSPILPKAIPNIPPVELPCMYKSKNTEHMEKLNRYRNVVELNVIKVENTPKKDLINEQKVCKNGHLTPLGILQHSYLGDHLRESYPDLLHNLDVSKDVLIQSTDYFRTIQSAASMIIGFLLDKLTKLPSNSQLLSIHVNEDDYPDTHYLFDETNSPILCPRVKEILNNNTQSQRYRQFLTKIDPLYNKLAMVIRSPKSTVPRLNRVVDIMYTRVCHGQGLPPSPTGRFPVNLVNEAFSFAHQFMSLKHGPPAEIQTTALLSQIAKRMLMRILKLSSDVPSSMQEQGEKIAVYSGHDSIITPLLINLGASDHMWPPYASRIVFELYTQPTDEPIYATQNLLYSYIRVLYNGKVITQNLRFCVNEMDNSELCKVMDFFRFVSDGLFTLDSVTNYSSKEELYALLYRRIKFMCNAL